MSDAQRVAGCERLDPCPSGPERREQLPHGRVRALCHQHGFMQVRAADACIPRDIRQRAQVIEIRVGDDHGLDHSAALVDPRQKRTRSDISDRARAAIEEHEGRARLDGDRGPIADREHRGLEVRDFPIDAADDGRQGQKHRKRKPRGGPHDSPRRTERHDARQSGCSADRPVDAADRERSRAAADGELDEFDLKPRRKMQRPAEESEQRWPGRSEDRLRICDGERRGGERRTQKGQSGSIRLQRAEVTKHDRDARDERRETRCGRARHELTCESEPRGMPAPRVVARHPEEPAALDRTREMTQRDHAGEAQLEPGPDGVGRRCDKHGDRRKRKHGVTVPITAERVARCADGGHQRCTRGARGGRHQDECADRRDAARERVHLRVGRHGSRHETDDPSEHGEVEAGDREDVRQADRSKGVLDRAVAILGVAEHERHEHRAYRDIAVGRNSLEKRRADSLAY